jgi:hypothetical protein
MNRGIVARAMDALTKAIAGAVGGNGWCGDGDGGGEGGGARGD